MYQTAAFIRDYTASTDTATVELAGIGVIDTWIDGIAIGSGINRGYLTHGQPVVVVMPDAHRICEAVVTAIAAAPNSVAVSYSGGNIGLQSGRSYIQTDAVGNGNTTVTFPHAFPNSPTIYAGGDDGTPLTLSAVGVASFIAAVTGAARLSSVYFSWYGQG